MPTFPTFSFGVTSATGAGPGASSGGPGVSVTDGLKSGTTDGAGFPPSRRGPTAIATFGAAGGGAGRAGTSIFGRVRWKTTCSSLAFASERIADAGISSSSNSARRWSPRLFSRLRADGAPDLPAILPPDSTGVTTAITSIRRHELDPQVADARLRKIDYSQDRLVVQLFI